MGRYPIVQALILEWAFWHFRKIFMRKQEMLTDIHSKTFFLGLEIVICTCSHVIIRSKIIMT